MEDKKDGAIMVSAELENIHDHARALKFLPLTEDDFRRKALILADWVLQGTASAP